MSDSTKIVMAVLGLGTIIVIAVVLSNDDNSRSQPADGFTPSAPGALLPATDAGAEAVRGGFSLAGQIATIFAAGQAADAARQERRDNSINGVQSYRDSVTGWITTGTPSANGSINPR